MKFFKRTFRRVMHDLGLLFIIGAVLFACYSVLLVPAWLFVSLETSVPTMVEKFISFAPLMAYILLSWYKERQGFNIPLACFTAGLSPAIFVIACAIWTPLRDYFIIAMILCSIISFVIWLTIPESKMKLF